MKLTQFEVVEDNGMPCLNCHHDLADHFESEDEIDPEDRLDAGWDSGCQVEECRCEQFV